MKTDLLPAKNAREMFIGERKIRKIFFRACGKFPENIFEKSVHALPHKTKSSLLPKNPEKHLPQTIFSDVIAIEGNQGHLLGVSHKKPPEICVKKSDPKKGR